jgi:hypothetical protein
MSGRFPIIAIVRHRRSRKERQSAHQTNVAQGGFQATLTLNYRLI